MPLIPKNLKPGAHKIGETPRHWKSIYARISDSFARYAILVKLKRGAYYIVDGKRDPIFHTELDELEFSRDGLGYCYDCAGFQSVVNGVRHSDPDATYFWFHGRHDRWTYRRKISGGRKLISSKGIDHPYVISCCERFTKDGAHILYTAYDYTLYDTQKTLRSIDKLVCDQTIIFDGSALDYEIANQSPYASWIGVPNGQKEVNKRYYVYLLGKRKEQLPKYYEALTFTVSPDHKHYFYGASDKEAEDRAGDFCGEQFVIFDGRRQRQKWMEIGWLENEFSPDSQHWTYVAMDHAGRQHLTLDGKTIWEADRFSGNQFSPKLNRHGFIAYDGLPKRLVKKARRWSYVMGPGCAVIDGRVYNPKQCISDLSLSFSPNGRHFSFIGHELEKGSRDSIDFRVYLDGRPIGEGDVCFGTEQGWYECGARFSSDSRRLYYFSIIDRSLYFNVVEVK